MKNKPVYSLKLEERRIRRNRFFAIMLALFCSFIPCEVYAVCSATGLFTLGGGTGKCIAGADGIFGSILCTFEDTLTQILSVMYCAFQTQLKQPIATTLSLAIAVFGVCVYTGYIQMTIGDALKAVVKLSVIWVFAMNSDYGILWIGKFFMGILQEGTQMAISPLGGNVTLTQPDSVFKGLFNFMSDPNVADLGATNTCPTGDCMNSTMLKNFSSCASYLMIVGVGLFVFMPVVIMFLLTVIIQYIALYVRAILGYLTSMVILTFLFILAPLFISFALFAVTRELFNRWLQFLQTFSIQAIILFSFVAMLGLITQGFTVFLYGLMSLLRPYDIAVDINIFKSTAANICSICEYTINTDANGIQTIKCLPAMHDPDPLVPAWITPNNMPAPIGNASTTMPNDVTGAPIVYYPNPTLMLGDVLSSQVNAMPSDPSQNGGKNYVVPILSVLKRTDFVLFVVANVVAFIVICNVFQGFIKRAPELAKNLGGVKYAANIGGGAPAEGGASIQYFGAEAAAAGLSGMQSNMLRDPFNANLSVAQRLKEGIVGRKMVADRKAFNSDEAYKRALSEAPLEGGLIGGFINGAENDDPYADHSQYYRQEKQLKQLGIDVEDARSQEKLAQTQVVEAGNKMQKNQEAVDKIKAQKDSADKTKALVAATTALDQSSAAYDKALENARIKTEIVRRKREDQQQVYAMMQSGGGRVRGAATQVDANGYVVHGGLRDGATRDKELETERAVALNDGDYAIKNERAMADARSASIRNSQSTGNGTTSNNSDSRLIAGNQDVTRKLDSLDKQMAGYGRFLSDDKKQEYDKILKKARDDLGKAKNAREAQAVIDSVKVVQDGLDQYSNKNIKQGAVVAGVAGAAGLMAFASQTTPTNYLDPAQRDLENIKANIDMKQTPDSLSSLMDGITGTPMKALGGMVNAAQDQKQKAILIIPASDLHKVDGDLKDVQNASSKVVSQEEAEKLMEKTAQSQHNIIESVMGGLGYMREEAGKMVPVSSLNDYDKKISDTQSEIEFLANGDQYMDLLQKLMAAPQILMDNFSDGLQKRVNDNENDTSPEKREALNEQIREARRMNAEAKDGDDYNDVFAQLQHVSRQIDTRDDQYGGSGRLQRTQQTVGKSEQGSVSSAFGGVGDRFKESADRLSNAHMQGGGSFLGNQLGDQNPYSGNDEKTIDPNKYGKDNYAQLQAVQAAMGAGGVGGHYVDPRYANYKAPKEGDKGFTSASSASAINPASVLNPGDVKDERNITMQKASIFDDVTTRARNAVMPGVTNVHMKSEATILGSPAEGGVGSAFSNLGDRVKGVGPSLSQTKMENDSKILGSPASEGLSGAIDNWKDRAKAVAPDFSGTHMDTQATLLGSDIKGEPEKPVQKINPWANYKAPEGRVMYQGSMRDASVAHEGSYSWARPQDNSEVIAQNTGATGALHGFTDRLKSSAPDFSNTHMETHATLLGTDLKTGAPEGAYSPDNRSTPAERYVSGYVASWDSQSADQKEADGQAKLEQARKHYEVVSSHLSARDQKEYQQEFASISSSWNTANTPEQERAIVHRLGMLEASYADILPDSQHEKANRDVAAIEKTLPATRNIIPADHVQHIEGLVASAKEDIAHAQTADEYDRALGKLQLAKDIQAGRADPSDDHTVFAPTVASATQPAEPVSTSTSGGTVIASKGAGETHSHDDHASDIGSPSVPIAHEHKDEDDKKKDEPQDSKYASEDGYVEAKGKNKNDNYKGYRNPNDPSTWGKVKGTDPCPCGSGLLYNQCHKKTDA